MKKLLLSAILFISMGTMAFAQQDVAKKVKKTPEEKAKHLTAELNSKLALTADQQSKIYAINLEGIKAQRASHQKGEKKDGPRVKTELQKRDAKINALLTDTQRKNYETWKNEKMKSAHKKGKKKLKQGTDKV